MMSAVMAVKKTEHLIVYKANGERKEFKVENNVSGVNKLGQWVENNNINTIIVIGNHRWAKLFLIALKRLYPGIKLQYAPSPKMQKGERENLKQRANSLLEKLENGENVVLQEFSFIEVKEKKRLVLKEPPTYKLSLDYVKITNKVRQIKHTIYSIFQEDIGPELVKEVERYLKNNKIPRGILGVIERCKEDRNKLTTYGYENDPDLFNDRVMELDVLFYRLSQVLNEKRKALEAIKKRIDRDHPLIKAVIQAKGPKKKKRKGKKSKNGEEIKVQEVVEDVKVKKIRRKIPDSLYVLLGFIGNRPWTYKKLKTYIGLDTREKNGRRVLDRRRPEVRQYFFIVAKTTALGQEAWEWFTEKHKDDEKYQERFKKYRGTMMIEALLQYICRELKIWQ
jgi:nucleoid DNA-binding protein